MHHDVLRRKQVQQAQRVADICRKAADAYRSGRVTREQFVAAIAAAQGVSHREAVKLSLRYVRELREAEAPDEVGLVDYPRFDAELSAKRADEVAELIDNSQSTEGFDKVVASLLTDVTKSSLNAGRATVIMSAEAAKVRWRRVSDGSPCPFCAMLVSAGPTYGSKESARGKFHDHCGCGVAEVRGPWRPSANERRYADWYNEAADNIRKRGEAIGTSNVTAEMRRIALKR